MGESLCRVLAYSSSINLICLVIRCAAAVYARHDGVQPSDAGARSSSLPAPNVSHRRVQPVVP